MESLSRAFELYEHCWAYAQDRGADIAFEIGTEEQQASSLGTLDELEHQLNSINNFCKSCGIPLPLYVVVQTGTKVMEMRNVGSFDSPVRVDSQVPSEILVPKIVEACGKHSIFLKQHNTDYYLTMHFKHIRRWVYTQQMLHQNLGLLRQVVTLKSLKI